MLVVLPASNQDMARIYAAVNVQSDLVTIVKNKILCSAILV